MRARVLKLAAAVARSLPSAAVQRLYTVGPLARRVRGLLNRAAPEGLTEIEIAAGGNQGLIFALDLRNEKDLWLGSYEPELQAAVQELIQPGWTIYDVGANVGYVSALFARRVGSGGRVVAFEALPENVARLRRNLSLNGLDSRVTVVAAAVTDREGPVRFLVAESNGMGKAEGSAGRQDVAYPAAVEVAGLTLDDYLAAHPDFPPQVVKVDIEGGEVLAFPGMERLLQEVRPLLLLELHGPQAAAVAWEALVRRGYRLARLRHGYPRILAADELDWKAYVVAFPDEVRL